MLIYLLISLVMSMGSQEDLAVKLLIEGLREKCARDRWEFAKYCKTRDEATQEIRPFPNWAIHHELFEAIDNNTIVQVNKSRQVMFSWCIALDSLWECHRAIQWDKVFGAKVNSIGDREAQEVMSRCHFMHDHLPSWLKNKPIKMNESLLSFANGINIGAYPTTKKIGRGFTVTKHWMDELAYLEWAYETWGSVSPTLGAMSKAILGSTPNGEFNLHFDLWTQAQKGLSTHKTMEIHYSRIPGRDAVWKEREMRSGKYPREEDWLREQELSFVGFAGKRVYPNFDRTTHCRKIAFVPSKDEVVYRGWDFGFHRPACIWLWKNGSDQWCELYEFMGEDMYTEQFARKVVEISIARFPNCMFRDYGDPAGKQKKSTQSMALPSEKSETTDFDIVAAVGREMNHPIWIQPSNNNIKSGIETVRRLLSLRADGQPGFIVDAELCPVSVNGFLGGYHYADKDVPDELPFKDGKHDHLKDAERYVLVEVAGPIDRSRERKSSAAVYTPADVPATNLAYIEDAKGWNGGQG